MYFDKIIGQDFAKKYLTNSIKKNKISHAYMFEGIDGIGKKKFSEELSKILLDTENVDSSPDYINIHPDGNSIKIAQIRKLQMDIVIKPHNKYKIYTINQANSMTIEAQNALLKTLEEPPEYAIIILITNNKEALLDTIKSRCEIIKFLPISILDLSKYLISQGIDESRAQLLSTFSRGSIKKAIQLSESADFATIRDEIQTYIEVILDKDIIDILEIPISMEKYKKDIISILDVFITYFRDIMIFKEKSDNSMIINIDKITFIKNLSEKITYSQVSRIIDIIEDIKNKIRSNCNFNISIMVMVLNIYEVII